MSFMQILLPGRLLDWSQQIENDAVTMEVLESQGPALVEHIIAYESSTSARSYTGSRIGLMTASVFVITRLFDLVGHWPSL